MGFEIGAAVELGLGQLDTINRNLKALRDVRPVYKMVGSSIVQQGAGPDFVQVRSSPAVGRVWNVLSLGVFGADDHTAVGGASAVFYATRSFITAAPGPLIDVISSPLSVPSTTWFSRQVVWVDSSELIQAIIYGGSNNAQFSIVANVAEYPVEAVEAMELS